MHPFEDLEDFFTEDLAIPMSCPSGAEVPCIFTDASIDNEHGEAQATMRTDDIIRESLVQGARVSVVRPATGRRTTYTIAGRQPDGTGISEVMLEYVG